MIIAIEGIDGSGKTTVVQELSKRLGIPCMARPSNGSIGVAIRGLLAAGFQPHHKYVYPLLFAADHLQDDKRLNELEASTEKGVVLVDRHWASSLVYAKAKGVSFEFTYLINQAARKPGLTIVLDIDPEGARERRKDWGEAFDDFETQEKVYKLYKQLGKHPFFHPGRVAYVDAEHNTLKAVVDECEWVIRDTLGWTKNG